MSEPLPEPPAGDFLAWVTQHPEQVAAYLKAVRSLSRLEVVITVGGVTRRGTAKLGLTNATLEITLPD